MTETPITPDITPDGVPTGRSPTPSTRAAETLGHIQADRPCVRCGFNLFGQPIARDPHYQLPIARCPECGQVAALQEYPGLGVWVRRWSAMISAVWLLLAVIYFVFTLVMVTAPVGAIHDANYRGLTVSIVEMYNQDSGSTDETANPNYRPWVGLPATWVEAQGLPARVREQGSVLSQLDPAYPLAVIAIWFTLYAAFLPWPVLLLRARRIKIAIYLGIVLAMGASIVGLISREQAMNDFSATNLALGIAWPTMVAVTYSSMLTAAFAAAYTGRPLMRWLVRAALPPRLRLPFAELWRADGKQFPAITGK